VADGFFAGRGGVDGIERESNFDEFAGGFYGMCHLEIRNTQDRRVRFG